MELIPSNRPRPGESPYGSKSLPLEHFLSHVFGVLKLRVGYVTLHFVFPDLLWHARMCIEPMLTLSKLVSNDRNEEAIRVITMYHGEGNRKSPIVLLSYKEMLEEIVISGSDKRWWDYSELWNTTTAKWRMVCVIGMAFFSQVYLSITFFRSKPF